MQTAATPVGNGWPGISGRARCTPSDVYGDVKRDAASGGALGGALIPSFVKCKSRHVSFRPDSERGVNAPSAERFPVQDNGYHESRARQ